MQIRGRESSRKLWTRPNTIRDMNLLGLWSVGCGIGGFLRTGHFGFLSCTQELIVV